MGIAEFLHAHERGTTGHADLLEALVSELGTLHELNENDRGDFKACSAGTCPTCLLLQLTEKQIEGKRKIAQEYADFKAGQIHD